MAQNIAQFRRHGWVRLVALVEPRTGRGDAREAGADAHRARTRSERGDRATQACLRGQNDSLIENYRLGT